MITRRLFFDANAVGAGAKGGEGGADAGQSAGNAGQGGAGAADSGNPGAGTGDGATPKAPELKLPQTLEESNKMLSEYHGKFHELEGVHTKLKGDHETMTQKIGTQGNRLAELQKMAKRVKDDPVAFAKELLKDAGVKFPESGSGDGISADDAFATAYEAGDKAGMMAAMKRGRSEAVAEAIKQVKGQFGVELNSMMEMEMERKYPDWKDQGDARMEVQARIAARVLTDQEVYHHVVRSENLPQAIEAAKKMGREEYRKELEAATAASHSAGGADGGVKGKEPHDPTSPTYFKATMRELQNTRVR